MWYKSWWLHPCFYACQRTSTFKEVDCGSERGGWRSFLCLCAPSGFPQTWSFTWVQELVSAQTPRAQATLKETCEFAKLANCGGEFSLNPLRRCNTGHTPPTPWDSRAGIIPTKKQNVPLALPQRQFRPIWAQSAHRTLIHAISAERPIHNTLHHTLFTLEERRAESTRQVLRCLGI